MQNTYDHPQPSLEDNRLTSVTVNQSDSETHSQPQSPTTYREMTSSSPTEHLTRGLSYASVVAKSPSPLAPNKNKAEHAPQPPPPSPSSPPKENVTPRRAQPASNASKEAGWKVVSHKKKGKGKAQMAATGRRASMIPVATSPAILPAIELPLSPIKPKADPRKRRHVADDLGEENSPSVEARKQNASSASPAPFDTFGPAALLTQTPSESSFFDMPPTAGPSKPNINNFDADSARDIGFAMASDSTRVESLLAPRSDSPPMSPSIDYVTSQQHSSHDVSSRSLTPRKGKGKGKTFRLGDILPLFPLPPSFTPSASPHTPSPANNRRSNATPVGPKRGHHWADASDSDNDAKTPRPSQSIPSSPPEVIMAEATPTPSIASDSSDRPPNVPLPFNVDEFEPDIVTPAPGTWRPSQGDSANWKERGMVVSQRISWTNIARLKPTVGLQIAFHGAEEPGVDARITRMLDVFRNTLHAPNTSIFSSYSTNGFHGMNLEPYWYLATDLSIEIIIELVRIGWLNLTEITLNFAFWTEPNPHLCACFRLIHRFGAQTKDEYEHLVRRELLDSDLYEITFEVLLRDIERGGMWRGSRKTDAIGDILDSIDVDIVPFRVGTNATEPIAVIYMKPPTADRRDWLRFSSQLKRHGFGSDLTGHPEPFAGRIWCGYCHSLGHTPATCRVRQTLGWHDIPLQMVPNQLPPVHNVAGRGGRGNGRGGGGGGRGRGGRGRGGGNL